jgi:ubiquinone/menaquinone biosynthesis C-methylase UbiE
MLARSEDLMPSNLHRYQRIARLYDLLDFPFEFLRYRRVRPLLFAGLTGRILDAGAGTGRNIPFYPPGASVTGIDFSPAMLTRAASRARRHGVQVELRQMDVTRLEFPADWFDAAVASFLFSVLPDDAQTLAMGELGRVVRPGGMIRLLELTCPRSSVRRLSGTAGRRFAAWAYGARFDRAIEETIGRAGLELVEAGPGGDETLRLFTARVPTRDGQNSTFRIS